MKILITGAPRVGKTTLLQKLIPLVPDAFWVISERTYDVSGIRNGFKAETSTGLSGVVDRREDFVPKEPMGNHQVDPAAIDRLFSDPITLAVKRHTQVIMVDEIGRIERYSPFFMPAIDKALASDSVVVATINQSDDWAQPYFARPDLIVVTLTAENGEEVTRALEAMLAGLSVYQSLVPRRQAKLRALSRDYAAADQYLSLRKLFKNTPVYLAESRYTKTGDHQYEVRGLTRTHQVVETKDDWSCDCDLSNGQGKFAGRASECSHIQTIKVIISE
jgi:nucleoside-triphosphatase